jgi:hypothetical protein
MPVRFKNLKTDVLVLLSKTISKLVDFKMLGRKGKIN